jgi:hypothetical protein
MNKLSFLFLFVLTLCLNSCTDNASHDKSFLSVASFLTHTDFAKLIIDTAGKTINTRVNCPEGYDRPLYAKNSFGFFLSNFPLKKNGAKVYYYNGEEKYNSKVYAAVLDIDVGEKDLQQCADAVMRLRAEYLYKEKMYAKIHFNFTNGFRCDYKQWAEGNRIKVSGNTTTWYPGQPSDYSYKAFRAYMNFIFTYAGTLSLSKELKAVPYDSIQVGDVFIHGGSPGHAVVVMDVAVDKKSKKRLMTIAQSYMPAQNIHLLVNPDNRSLSPWYDLQEEEQLNSPEWTFQKTELKRFKE